MKNTMLDLNNHLFEALERLNDEDLKGDALKSEIDRSRAMSGVAKEIINNGRLVLDAQKMANKENEFSGEKPALPSILTGERALSA